MSLYQLWLHPVHGVRGQQIVGRRTQELDNETSVAARQETLSSLFEVVRDVKIVKDELVEVFHDSRNLYAVDNVAQSTLTMPLSLSQVAEQRLERSDGVLGLISYAQPMGTSPTAASGTEMESSVAWVFVVTYKNSPKAVSIRADVFGKCVTELALSGAIRTSPRSFETIQDSTVEGGFGQVRVLGRQQLMEEVHHDGAVKCET
eukprot:TRINITY_DN10828_c0_g2_i1.p1 TRINITY_DN10828_c0_g2~~TRINITY_DN10828_c0_g2_i1.p1  ORF type:complete len:204 (+),score=29.24 TRINITY_DN10828_c0_g2_i1:60-671(+)